MKCKFFRFPEYYGVDTIEDEINMWLKSIGAIDIVNINTNKDANEIDVFIFYSGRREKLEELDRLSSQ